MPSLFSTTLTENNYQDMCHELIQAESEKDIIHILQEYQVWDDDTCWTNYGGKENNVATIGNQADNAEAAFVEKLTNSIDAVLMKEAQLRGLDPKSKEAPQSIDEAMQKFYGVSDQNIKTADKETIVKLKNEVCVVATGSKHKPNLSIIDKGEGQTPNNMPTTILSLTESNKIDIRFVQGQFNQGGTAVLPYCGDNHFQLIVSKRHPQIASKDDDSYDKWGFTIVRRNARDKHSRRTRYEYLTINGKIPSFQKNSLPLLPGNYPNPREHELSSGTYIKLYEYNLKVSGYIHTKLNFYLSILLPGAKLPIAFNERRTWDKNASTGNPNMRNYLYGHFYRFKNPIKDNIEKGFPFTFTITVSEQRMEVLVACIKPAKNQTYKKHEGVLFTLNGQTQGIIPDSIFDRKDVGLGYLKNTLMVFVDATYLDTDFREDLFMSDRQRLRDNKFSNDIKQLIREELSANATLHNLQAKRRKEAMKEQIEKSPALENTMMKLLRHSPSLNILFNTGKDINTSTAKDLKGEVDLLNYMGSEIPSFFILEKEFSSSNPKNCPANKSFRITFKTDVEDIYFTRDKDQGIYEFSLNGERLEKYSFKLRQGKATFTNFLPEDTKVGDLLQYSYKIYNSNPDIEQFQGSFYVHATEAYEADKVDKKNNDNKPKKQALNLPQIRDVYKQDWNQYEFDEHSAVEVVSNNGSYDFIINMDNKYIVLERKNMPNDQIRLNELFKNALFLHAFSMLENETYANNLSQISEAAKSFARVVIPMINLGDVIKP